MTGREPAPEGASAMPPADRASTAAPAVSAPECAPALQVSIRQTHPVALQGAFECAAGELLALVGPSGAGKTSTLRLMAGLTRPQGAGAQARVVVGGQTWCDSERGLFVPPQQRHVGLVFQHYALMPHLSALDNVALALLELPRAPRRIEAAQWLERMQLPATLHGCRPADLSGGEQQRVALARALARQPRLLLLDEPFSAVDQMNRQALYPLLADLRRTLQAPIVLVTHDLDEARRLADRMVVMDAGRVLQQGRPEAIHRAPRNARVADLVGIQNRFTGLWLGPHAENGWGRLQWLGTDAEGPELRVRDKGRLDLGQRVSWIVPGEAITLGDEDTAFAAAAMQRAAGGSVISIPAVVAEARHLGEITLATLALKSPQGVTLRVTLAGPQRRRIAPGAALPVQLDLALVHVMPVRNP